MSNRYNYRPIIAVLYWHDGKRMRTIGEFKTHRGYRNRLLHYAQHNSTAKLYLLRFGEWYRVELRQLFHENGELWEWGFELVESDGLIAEKGLGA